MHGLVDKSASKPEIMSSILQDPFGGKRTRSGKLASDLCVHFMALVHTHTHPPK